MTTAALPPPLRPPARQPPAVQTTRRSSRPGCGGRWSASCWSRPPRPVRPWCAGDRRQQRLQLAEAGGPAGAAAAWREIEDLAVDHGIGLNPAESARATANRLAKAAHLHNQGRAELRAVVQAAEQGWYGPAGGTGLAGRHQGEQGAGELCRPAVDPQSADGTGATGTLSSHPARSVGSPADRHAGAASHLLADLAPCCAGRWRPSRQTRLVARLLAGPDRLIAGVCGRRTLVGECCSSMAPGRDRDRVVGPARRSRQPGCHRVLSLGYNKAAAPGCRGFIRLSSRDGTLRKLLVRFVEAPTEALLHPVAQRRVGLGCVLGRRPWLPSRWAARKRTGRPR